MKVSSRLATMRTVPRALRASSAAISSMLSVSVLHPKAARWDETEAFPWENGPVLRDAGLLGLALPEAYGGAGGTVLDLALGGSWR